MLPDVHFVPMGDKRGGVPRTLPFHKRSKGSENWMRSPEKAAEAVV